MSSKYRRLVAHGRAAAIPAVAAAVVAAGAIGVSSASAHRAHAAGAAISKAELAKLQKVVTQAEGAPTWTAPGPKVSGKVLKGKTIYTFPISSAIGACAAQQADFTKAASALGAKVDAGTVPPTAGGPPGWQAQLGDAVSEKANAVVMFCGVEPSFVSGQLAQLKAAGVPVVDGNYNETNVYTGIQGETAVNTAQGVQDDLADALVNLKGKAAHILFLNSQGVIQYQGAKNGLNSAIKKWCPSSCKVYEDDIPNPANWETDGSGAASYLNAHKDINTVIVTFDGMSDGIVTQVAQAASSHPGLKIYAWGGGAAEERDVQTSPVFAADSGPDERWDAYDALDQVIRLLNHKAAAPVTKEIDPNEFFTKSNVGKFFGGAGPTYSDKAFSNGAFIKDFDALWGVK